MIPALRRRLEDQDQPGLQRDFVSNTKPSLKQTNKQTSKKPQLRTPPPLISLLTHIHTWRVFLGAFPFHLLDSPLGVGVTMDQNLSFSTLEQGLIHKTTSRKNPLGFQKLHLLSAVLPSCGAIEQ